MPRPLSEQVVVIVGASSGIGRASALEFAARGSRVVCAARSKQALDTLVDQIRQEGGTAVAAPADVADPAAVRALARLAEQRLGGRVLPRSATAARRQRRAAVHPAPRRRHTAHGPSRHHHGQRRRRR
jgi:NAD(P)-dependent dehydrogenase (short-subunit alcohol dehydrogenase family)